MNAKSIGKLATLVFLMVALLGVGAAQSPPTGSPAENAPPAAGEKPAKKTTKLHLVVKGGEDSKPVAGAQVDITSQDEGADFSTEIHTGPDGIADIVVPRGKVLIQVIAAHFAVGGASQNLQSEKQTVEIKLSVQAANN